MKKIIVLTIILFINLYSFAQNDGIIIGQLLNSDEWGVEFANVTLLKPDSTLVKGTISNLNGEFKIDGIKNGEYIICISHLQYENKFIKDIIINEKKMLCPLGNVLLNKSTNRIEEITVVGNKNVFEKSIRKEIFNVTNSVKEKITETKELLNLVPSVSVDVFNKIEVDGNSAVLILLNGRRLTEGSPVNMLIPEQISKIEVVKNPSSKYAGEGYSSIINIILKKNPDKGLNAYLNACIPGKVISNYSVNVNYNFNKFRLYTNYQFNQKKYYYNKEDTRSFTDNQAGIIQRQDNSYSKKDIHSIVLGSDIFINKYNRVNFSGKFSYKDFRDENIIFTESDNPFRTRLINNDNVYTYNFTSYYQHVFNNPDEKIQLEFLYSNMDESDNYFYSDSMFISENTIMRNNKYDYINNLFRINCDYFKPIGENFNLESGIKIINSSFDNLFITNNINNDLEYNQNLMFLFSDLSAKYGKFDFWGGFSLEQNNRKINTIKKSFNNYYFNTGVSYNINRKNVLNISYNKTVSRPSFWSLDPFVYYNDSITISKGNPELEDYYINSFDFSYRKYFNRNYLKLSLFYDITPDVISGVNYFNNGVMVNTYENVNKEINTGFRIYLSTKLFDFWKVMINSKFFYQTLKTKDADNSLFSNHLTLYSFVTLPYDITFSQQLNYKGKTLITNGEYIYPTYTALYLNKKVFNKKGTISITYIQPFLKYKINTNCRYSNLNYSEKADVDLTSISISFTYKFNTGKNIQRKVKNRTNWSKQSKEKGY